MTGTQDHLCIPHQVDFCEDRPAALKQANPTCADMSSPIVPKTAAQMARVGESAKTKHPSAMGKSPQARLSTPVGEIKVTAVRSLSGQSASSKHATGQSGTGKASVLGQSAAGKPATIHSSPGSKLALGQSSPRKSIFSKSVGQLGAMKLGSAQSPIKAFHGKSSSGKSPGLGLALGQFDLPLALRKKRRPNAGMKRDVSAAMDKILGVTKSPKDGKTPPKRKLSQSSPNGSKMGVKHKADYVPPSSKKRKISRSNRDQDSRNDFYCWICHKEGSVICCELCPRVYHPKCAKVDGDPVGDWFCPECERATNAECVDSQSHAMSSLTLDQLAKLLMYALKRMKHSGAEPFLKPVNVQQNPGYEEFVFNPMDMSSLEKNIKKRMYGSTEAFLLDAKWILHNCVVFNGSHHKLTNSARMIIKICEYEMKEIEICPDCYLSASIKRDKWFCEVCRDPHKLVWARLQGFPFWPSKVLREKDGLLDVRFFGQHDRAWVPISSCFMYAAEIPIPSKKKTSGLSTSVLEMEVHILNLQKTFGKDCFRYAPQRTAYGKFDCLSINPKDREKWPANRAVIGSVMNGVNDRSNPKPRPVVSDVKIKIEPMDTQVGDGISETRKLSEDLQGTTRKGTVLAKKAAESEKVQCLSSQKTNKTPESSEGTEKDEQTGFDLSSENAQAIPDSMSEKNGTSNVVRRQVFSITRRRTGDVSETAKSTTKISDTLSDDSNKLDAGNAESDDSEVSSPSKVPVGVFEVSDESLDIDPEVEVQSPAVQLLGKTHVSTNNLGRSLANKLSNVGPGLLGKMGSSCSRDDELDEEKEAVNVDQEEGTVKSTEKGISASKSKKNPEHKKLCSDISKLSNNSDSRDKQTTSQCIERDEVDKPLINKSEEVDDSDQQDCNKSPKSNLDVDERSESSNPDEDIPSTSQSMPTKDKFHIKLGKTIETMKASLGIERLHSVEKETSDSESSAAESDSDSSEADHSEDSEIEVDDEQSVGIDKKDGEYPSRDGSGKTTASSEDAVKSLAKKQNETLHKETVSQSPTSDAENNQPCKDLTVPDAKGGVKSSTQDELGDIPGPSTSEKSKMDSDIDLVMSCHSEMSDFDEGELVIDESRTVNQTNSKPNQTTALLDSDTTITKDSSCGELEQCADAGKMDVRDNQAPMETDDVILVSDPFEPPENVQSDQSKTQQAEEAPPLPSMQEKEINCETAANSFPPPINLPSGNSTSSKDILPIATVDENLSSSVPPKAVLPFVDPAWSAAAPLTSFPNIIETLQANKRSAIVPDPPKTSAGESVEGTIATVVLKDTAPAEPQADGKDKEFLKKILYKKYVEKMSSALEGVLDEFSADMLAGCLLQEAKKTIAELKQKIQELTWERKQEQVEFKQIMDLAVAEMKECMEAETTVALTNLSSQLNAEKQDEVRKTKTKQWCANCGKDAVFFCCWNTSYCDYPCQQSHWAQHRTSCQQRSLGNTVVQVQQVQNKQQITASSTAQTPSPSDIIKIISPAGKSAAEQLRIISNQQANQSSSLAQQHMPMQLQPGIQQHISQSATQPLHQAQVGQQAGHQPLHQTLQQQVQQVMQPHLSASTQPMQTLIQYVQAPRMSAPVPVRQLINRHPYDMASGRIVGSGGIRVVRP